MLQLLGLKSNDSSKALPKDRLQVQHLVAGKAVLQAQSGLPASSDSLDYDPVQRLLAVGTQDGRIQVIGRDGVEQALSCRSHEATQQLLFLINRGGIVRLNQAGILELFGADPAGCDTEEDSSKPLHTLAVQDDKVCRLALLHREPYLLLGCSSGIVRVCGLVNASGVPVAEARQVRGLILMPYFISPQKLLASGPVQLLSVKTALQQQLLLVAHEGSGLAVWDLRAQVLLATVSHRQTGSNVQPESWEPSAAATIEAAAATAEGNSDRASISRITAAAWVHDSSRGDVATGHANGDVCIWAFPAAAQASNSTSCSSGTSLLGVAGQLQLFTKLQVAAASSPCKGPRSRSLQHNGSPSDGRRPVVALQYVQPPSRTACLLVLGGLHNVAADSLVLLPLPERQQVRGIDEELSPAKQTSQHHQQQTAAAPTKLACPSFVVGHALVPSRGAMAAAAGQETHSAVMVLTAVGQLWSYDLAGLNNYSGAATTGVAAATAASRPLQPISLLNGRFQGQPRVTAARLRTVPIERIPLQGLQGASIAGLKEWAQQNSSKQHSTAADAGKNSGITGHKRSDSNGSSNSGNGSNAASRWGWVLNGGRPPLANSSCSSYGLLYCTGHVDGCVRLWDMTAHAPQLLGCVPSSAALKGLEAALVVGSDTARAAGQVPVSTLEFAWEQGLLISGHQGGEVRVYQFSDVPKRIDCVIFDSVGSRNNNQGIVIQEPAGFQLRLLTCLHTADIVSSAYLPQFKMVAVSDAAGSVSLIDLAKPAVQWFQSPWANQPVVALALGHMQLPSKRQRNDAIATATSAAKSVGNAGSTAVAHVVVALAADSQLAVLDAATGFFVSKAGILLPKHLSPALHVELLDSSGTPTWMARDVVELVKQTQAAAKAAAGSAVQRQQGTPFSKQTAINNSMAGPVGEALSDDSDNEHPATSGQSNVGYVKQQSTHMHEQGSTHRVLQQQHSDIDSDSEARELNVDELLAKAAWEVESKDEVANKQSARKHIKQQQRRSSSSPSPERHKHEHTKAQAEVQSAAPTGATAATPATLISLSGEPTAAYVLTASATHIRLYPASHAVVADRTTCRKVELPGRLVFVNSFAAGGAPALACLLEQEGEMHLQVYTLPGVELVRDMPLSSLLGWHWDWAGDKQPQHQGTVSSTSGPVCAGSRHGHLALLGHSGKGELLRLGLAANAQAAPAPPAALHDWDIATAAHAAALAVEQQHQRAWAAARTAASPATNAAPPGVGASVGTGAGRKVAAPATNAALSSSQQVQSPTEVQGSASGRTQPKLDFKGLIGKVGDNVTKAGGEVARGFVKAFDEAHKGLAKVTQVCRLKVLFVSVVWCLGLPVQVSKRF
eukprot:GHRR01011838.1.p1 GENE.GHRR01011838.1~~GHRR01011838.1.p1  ORF type:complete len:1352 (+),score=605.93 GHRR01011838.1:400-4455(+)